MLIAACVEDSESEANYAIDKVEKLLKQTDEVLSIAAVDGEGTVKMDEMFHPRHRKRWSDATKINGITPEMTIGKPTLPEKKIEIENIFNDADVIVGWNLPFDLRMLYAGGDGKREILRSHARLRPGLQFDAAGQGQGEIQVGRSRCSRRRGIRRTYGDGRHERADPDLGVDQGHSNSP
jgi:hypothetical protein